MDSYPSVAALTHDPTPKRLERALAAQRHAPDKVIHASRGLRAGLEHALGSDADWIWVLDGSTAPQSGCLLALLEALERLNGLPEPILLGGVTLTDDGDVNENRALWYRRDQIDIALSSAASRLLPIRASSGSTLVRGSAALTKLPSPRALFVPGAVLEWTIQVLRSGTGYLVPDSQSDALDPDHDPTYEPRTAARMLTRRGLPRGDRIRLAWEVAYRTASRSGKR